jgi:hypothetical protein
MAGAVAVRTLLDASRDAAASAEEQKNWTHVRQCFGYERHDNPKVVALLNTLIQKAYGPLRHFIHASLKLERKERTPGVPGRLRRVYGKPQTPLGPGLGFQRRRVA